MYVKTPDEFRHSKEARRCAATAAVPTPKKVDSEDVLKALTLGLFWWVSQALAEENKIDGTEGAIDGRDIAELAREYGIPNALVGEVVARLVAAELWHDHSTIKACLDGCADDLKGALPLGSYYHHRWRQTQLPPQKDTYGRMAELRRKRLYSGTSLVPDGLLEGCRMPVLREAVQRRDHNCCRYCAIVVDWNDRRGRHAATFDHLDPWGENTFENLVVACNQCNGRKGQRNPVEAEMPLLDPPDDPDLDATTGVPVPDGASDLSPGIETAQKTKPAIKPDLSTRARPRNGTGQDQVRTGSGTDPGTGPVGGRPGSRDRAGPARPVAGSGSGQDGARARAPTKKRGRA